MTNLLDRAGRCCRLATSMLLLAVLAACGPGTGGTGTGPINVSFSGSTGAGATAGPDPSCQANCDRVELQLEPERVELRAGCRRFVHVGAWAVDGDGRLVLDGTVETVPSSGAVSAPATLHLQFSEGEPTSPQVTAVLTAPGGGVLAGPALLQRGDGSTPTPPADCGKAP